WEYPPATRAWTFDAAKRTMPALTKLARSANDFEQPGKHALGPGTSYVDSTLTVAHARQAARIGSASVGPVALGAAGVALLVLLMAAGSWLELRRKEISVLALRGAGAGALATKGVLEMSLPMLLGGAVGMLSGDVLIRTVGEHSHRTAEQ